MEIDGSRSPYNVRSFVEAPISFTQGSSLLQMDPSQRTYRSPRGCMSPNVTLQGPRCSHGCMYRHHHIPTRRTGSHAFSQVEDAAVLGALLSHISHLNQLPVFLKAYQDLRLQRTAITQLSSRLNQKVCEFNASDS